jgi:hypothetical protein
MLKSAKICIRKCIVCKFILKGCNQTSRKDDNNRKEFLMHIERVECTPRVLSAFPRWNVIASKK